MRSDWLPPASLLLLALAARLHGLTSQLWHDEISALGSIRRPALEIATTWPGASSHVLYELLARAGWVAFGEGPLGIRLPAALLGAAAVPLLYWLVLPWFGRRAAWFVAGLFALSYHHIFYSQNARGYTTLIFFALLATLLLVRMVRSGGASRWLLGAYAVAGALTAYTNLLGMFVVAAHVAVVLAWRAPIPAGRRLEPFPLVGFLAAAALAGVLTALLYLPLLGGVVGYTQASVASPAEGPRLGLWLVVEVVEGLAAGFGGIPGLVAGGLLGLVGLWAWLRRAPLVLALLAAPIVLQAGVLLVMGAGIHPRYLALALPLVIAVGGLGVVRAVESAAQRARPRLGNELAPVALVLVVLASAYPLLRYYSIPKQDYLGAIEALDTLAEGPDRKAGVTLAGNALNGYYGAGYDQVRALDDLLALEAYGSRIWLVTTLERLLDVEAPELREHIHSHYDLVRVLPGSVGDGAVRIYLRGS
jgi:4-amino-4-deoxy-L-arabinose transferase-like glycosyltransferase